MFNFKEKTISLSFNLQKNKIQELLNFLESKDQTILFIFLLEISVLAFIYFYSNGLGLAYNDARSHLDIGRRVVEGLKPGLAQLGSVWLPLPHILMIPTVWNDFMWHSGLAGAIVSMISFVSTGILIYLTLQKLGVGLLGRFVGAAIFVFNINILYLQSTAMTELLMMATTLAATYYLILWSKSDSILDLIKSAFWLMLATLTRYDGWFLLVMIAGIIALRVYLKKGYKIAEGTLFLFSTLAAFGIILWFGWNLIIFKDPLYFAFGPYSAHAQQTQLDQAGNLITKGNILYSLQVYLYALFYNVGSFTALLGFIGAILLWLDKRVKTDLRLASFALLAPLFFNVIALFMGHSVLFIQGLSGNTWFNVRYGSMVIPSIAIFIGFLIDRVKSLRLTLIGLLVFVTFFSFNSFDAVTIDDAKTGSSQKNVTEISGWLKDNAADKKGFILISVASHDAIIFSSDLPMSRFIHEGTGTYWDLGTSSPDKWARWIVMRTYDDNDQTWRLVKGTDGFRKYSLVSEFPFASIYELKDEYLNELNTEPVLPKQK